MTTRTPAIVFDVNETLSDFASVADAFVAIGAPRELAASWFAALLRDGFALTTAGDPASFLQLAEHGARSILASTDHKLPLDDAVAAILQALSAVTLHTDVADGVRQLSAGGHRLFTLSNGSTALAERLFREADLGSYFDRLLSVEQHTAWKPAREAYERLPAETGVPLGDSILVAVHPWDINGAARAGMKTAWLNRAGTGTGTGYPPYFAQPTFMLTSLGQLAAQIAVQLDTPLDTPL